MRRRILFIHLEPSSFVLEDLRILNDEFDVVTFRFGSDKGSRGLRIILLAVRQFVWLLRELPRASAVFGWFADYHMALPVFLARLRSKPVAVALGGFDAIRLPSIGYGAALSRWRWPLARYVLRGSDVLLPVSPSLIHSENVYSEWPRRTEQGVRALVDDAAPDRVLPTGYDPEDWPMGPTRRERIVGTVGLIDSDRTLRRKGIDLLFECASLMPDVTFRVIGVRDRETVAGRYGPPDNVELVPALPRRQLASVYHELSVYLQLSRAEGLPNVLCEAMLCGCIPVGSAVFGIPDAIGDTGFVVERPEAAAIRDAVERALDAPAERRAAARSRIMTEFPLERRRDELLSIVRTLVDARRSDG